MKTEIEIKREIESLEISLNTIKGLIKHSSNELEYSIRLQVRNNLTERINTLKWVLNE